MDSLPAGPSNPTDVFGYIRAKIFDEDGCPDVAYIPCFIIPVGPSATSC
jgi:hypothetical protein